MPISFLLPIFSAGETHESVSEKRVMERGDADESMDDTERVGVPTLQVVVPVVVVVALFALFAVGFVIHQQTCHHKKQHPVKFPTEDSDEVL